MAERLSTTRLREIKDLLRYESSISFHSSRAKESMLLLVAKVEELWALTPTSAPVESAGDETGDPLVVGWERMVIKAAVANALDGHRNDADLATHITNEVISNLHEARGGDQ